MTGATLLTVLGTLGIPTILASVIAFVGTRASLRANAPKTEAEADQVQAQAAVQNLNAQAAVIATLVSENSRLTLRATTLEQSLTEKDLAWAAARDALGEAQRLIDRLRAALVRLEAWAAHAWAEGAADEPPPPEFPPD